MKISPFAPAELCQMPSLSGVRFASMEAGIRYKGRKDLMLCLLPENTVVAGTLTQSKTCSSAIDWCRTQLTHGKARALVVNSGNANAFTGMKGQKAVEVTAIEAAKAVGCAPKEVMIASTGVIGEALDPGIFTHFLGGLATQAHADGWHDAAQTIMTTDTFAKLSTRTVQIDGVDVRINGFAKGSGMIAPDMATMLSFVFTDAPIAQEVLQSLCSELVVGSFNAITVDSDTSTSDTLLVFATGKADIAPLETLEDQRLEVFRAVLFEVLLDLAQQIVKDGEGISKFIEVQVKGAQSDAAAKTIALSIANSPLVKTAMAGEDPNWGRIIMAVGKAGEEADRDRLGIWFGDIEVARDGEVAPDYSEDRGAGYMKGSKIVIRVELGLGAGKAMVWTCDLTHEYISINADYRS
ncbi:MAG: bifunctional glutamate N-acetyltransferase/amino-acid acetyltransferase ArgJ [Hyphomicrobiaceae bacterium]|nr:bifunctional glutamate N-acetyltransferase/amino-acid acetyltransferase ArgJ [Hyphomicrobiaceae bacterium]